MAADVHGKALSLSALTKALGHRPAVPADEPHLRAARKGTVSAAKVVEIQGKGTVFVAKVVARHDKSTVLAAKAVETHSKCCV